MVARYPFGQRGMGGNGRVLLDGYRAYLNGGRDRWIGTQKSGNVGMTGGFLAERRHNGDGGSAIECW